MVYNDTVGITNKEDELKLKASPQHVGQRIREIRKRAGLDQTDFAKKVRAGRQNDISRYETGRIPRNVDLLVRISNFGNVSLDWLLTGVEFQDRQKQSAA